MFVQYILNTLFILANDTTGKDGDSDIKEGESMPSESDKKPETKPETKPAPKPETKPTEKPTTLPATQNGFICVNCNGEVDESSSTKNDCCDCCCDSNKDPCTGGSTKPTIPCACLDKNGNLDAKKQY